MGTTTMTDKPSGAPPKKRGTRAELARWLGKSERTISDYVHRLDLKPDKAGRYSSLAVYAEQARREDALAKKKNPALETHELPLVRTWADVEKRERVQKLKIEIQSLQGTLIPIEDVRNTLAELCAAVRGSMANFVEHVAAGKRDPDLLRWAEQARDAALADIVGRINAE